MPCGPLTPRHKGYIDKSNTHQLLRSLQSEGHRGRPVGNANGGSTDTQEGWAVVSGKTTWRRQCMSWHCPLLVHSESQLSWARRAMDSSIRDDSRDRPCRQNVMQIHRVTVGSVFLEVRSMKALVLGGLAFAAPFLPFLLPSDIHFLPHSSPLYLSLQAGLCFSPRAPAPRTSGESCCPEYRPNNNCLLSRPTPSLEQQTVCISQKVPEAP